MILTNLDSFFTRDVTGGRKSCPGYIFLQKYLKGVPTVIIFDAE